MYIYMYAIVAREMRRVRRTSALTLICFSRLVVSHSAPSGVTVGARLVGVSRHSSNEAIASQHCED